MMIAANEAYNLSDPAQARLYIKNFKHILGKEASYVTTTNGRLIQFINMSDDEAVWIANELRDMEASAKLPETIEGERND